VNQGKKFPNIISAIFKRPHLKNAKRRKEFQFVSAWEYKGEPKDALLHKEPLVYENIEVKERSYK